MSTQQSTRSLDWSFRSLHSPLAVSEEAPVPWRDTACYTDCMTSVQIPTRFRDEELADLDAMVADGVAKSRSQVIRLAVEQLVDTHRRRKIGESMAAAYLATPQSDDDNVWAVANAIAMTEAEPW